VVRLWVDLFGETGDEHVWTKQIAPQIEPRVLPEVFRGSAFGTRCTAAGR